MPLREFLGREIQKLRPSELQSQKSVGPSWVLFRERSGCPVIEELWSICRATGGQASEGVAVLRLRKGSLALY